MIKRRDSVEVLYDIKNIMPEFDRSDFLEYVKWTTISLYNAIKKGNKSEIRGNCDSNIIDKLSSDKIKYRITDDIDHISVQYVEIIDFIKEKNKKSIKLYASVYFYDNAKNNMHCPQDKEKYWNDIWIITYDLDSDTEHINSINNKCPNCGANMIYNKQKDQFKCNYCSYVVNNSKYAYWKLSDIEVEL